MEGFDLDRFKTKTCIARRETVSGRLVLNSLTAIEGRRKYTRSDKLLHQIYCKRKTKRG